MRWALPLALLALGVMGYVIHTVTLPNGIVATVTATISSVSNTKYIIRTIVYNGTTVTDTITVIPGTGNVNALNKVPGTPVMPLGLNQTMTYRYRHHNYMNMTNTTMGAGMGGMGHGHHGMAVMTRTCTNTCTTCTQMHEQHRYHHGRSS